MFTMHSTQMQRLLEQARRTSKSDQPLLISGESGTEKERIARYIHEHSSRADGPFVRVDCAALMTGRWDQEIFGEDGTSGWRPGKLDLATGGTLFLDECSEMPLAIQTKLLIFLESRALAAKPGAVQLADVRIIAATTKDLTEQQRVGHFREDLYQSLGKEQLSVPALRERKDDIERLADEILARLAAPGHPPVTLTPEAIAALLLYAWPGNVRELESVLRQAALMAAESQRISIEHLPEEIATCLQPTPPRQLLKRYTRSAELFLIRWALSVCNGDRTRAARFLGLSRAAIYKKLRLYPEFQSRA